VSISIIKKIQGIKVWTKRFFVNIFGEIGPIFFFADLDTSR